MILSRNKKNDKRDAKRKEYTVLYYDGSLDNVQSYSVSASSYGWAWRLFGMKKPDKLIKDVILKKNGTIAK